MTSASRTLGAVLYDRFELLDLYGPLEMFGSLGPELRIVTVAAAAGPVRSTQGPQTVAEYAFADVPKLDLILVPGGVGSVQQMQDPELLGFLRERAPAAERVMSVCSGAAILAQAGLLAGRRATTNKLFFDLVTGPTSGVEWVTEARWVEDGPVVTSSGVSAGTDMALAVIACLYGRERADEIAVLTEYEWNADPDRDPFAAHRNRGDLQRLLAAAGRAAD